MTREDILLDCLDPEFRRMVEASAALIIAAGPDQAGRIAELARLTLAEARRERDPHKADIAFALAAEFRRRACGGQARHHRTPERERRRREPALHQHR